jgi:hypothetical protein
MNEEITNKLQETLVGLIDSATSAAQFVQSEIPEVLEQLLMWKMAESIVICVVAVVLLLSPVPIYKITNALAKKNDDDGFFVINLFSIPLLIIGLCEINLDWLQIWLAPKVYLIEYAANLVN